MTAQIKLIINSLTLNVTPEYILYSQNEEIVMEVVVAGNLHLPNYSKKEKKDLVLI